MKVSKYLDTVTDVKAYVWMDWYGDGKVMLPSGDPELLAENLDAISGPGGTTMKQYKMPLERIEVLPELKIINAG